MKKLYWVNGEDFLSFERAWKAARKLATELNQSVCMERYQRGTDNRLEDVIVDP